MEEIGQLAGYGAHHRDAACNVAARCGRVFDIRHGLLATGLFNRKAKLTDDINAWLGILYWCLLVAAAFAYYSGGHS